MNRMELRNVRGNATSDAANHVDDSTIYLFGSELYCGWCLESFACPVRLKIHCHIEHLATCSCGEEFSDKQTLCRHVASVGCALPPPFRWSHFVKLPCDDLKDTCITEAHQDDQRRQSLDEIETEGDKLSSNSGKRLSQSTEKTSATEGRENQKQKDSKDSRLQSLSFKQRKFSCEWCPYQSTHKTTLVQHVQQKHAKVANKSAPQNRSGKALEKSKDSNAVENNSVVDTENHFAGKSGHTNLSLPRSYVHQQSGCEKHRIDDIEFIASCFSSPGTGKLLSCDLCNGEFGELEEAAMHVYNSHLSAVEHWRDRHAHGSDTRPFIQCNADEKSAVKSADNQLEKFSTALECDVPKSVGNGNMCMNISEHSLEQGGSDNCQDQSITQLSGSKVKRKLTPDDCKVLVSSLCQLFKCLNSEHEADIPADKTVDVHGETVEGAVTASSPTKKLKTASYLKTTKMAFSALQLISRKCKYCHRVCSSRYNCQRHEAVCHYILPNSKSSRQQKCSSKQQTMDSDNTVLKIRGSHIFYCSRCGFSDSDQQVVEAHLMEPHTVVSNKLQIKVQPGHDYIGSLRTAVGNFQCSLCGSRQPSRSKMLKHMRAHSSVLALPGSTCTASPESMSAKVEENVEMFSSAICGRSCPKCSLSFSSVAKYLSHRAVCKAIQQHQKVQHRDSRVRSTFKYSYLFNYCEQASNGRWQCKLCQNCKAHRADLYKHIRDRHTEVVNTEETKVHGSILIQQTADGLWECVFCGHSFTCSYDVHKHLKAKHATKLNQKLDTSKQNAVFAFCAQTSDGRFQCVLCKCSRSVRSALFKHVRAAHSEALSVESMKSSTVLSCSTVTVSASSVGKRAVKNPAMRSALQKSQVKHFVKPCPNCKHLFTCRSSYQNHVKWCGKLVVDSFMEKVSSHQVRCRVCQWTYRDCRNCRQHIRRKHLSSGELKCVTRDHTETDTKTHTDENEAFSDNSGMLDQTVIKMEN